MTRKWTRRSALALIGGGASLTLLGSSGFTTLEGERVSNLDAVDDSAALLGVGGTDATTTPFFENNSSENMEVTLDSTASGAEFDVDDNGTFQNPPVTFNLASGGLREVGILADVDPADVEITADLLRNGNRIGRIELVRTYQIPQTAAIRDVDAQTKQVGNSGKFEFGLTNTSNRQIAIDGIGVPSTENPDAAQVGGKNNDDILIIKGNGNESIVDQVIDVGGGVVPFSRSGPANAVDLPPSQEVSFEFQRFREQGAGGGSGINPGDIEIEVRAEDGSTVVLELIEQ